MADKKGKTFTNNVSVFTRLKKGALLIVATLFLVLALFAIFFLTVSLWLFTGDTAKKSAGLIESISGVKTSIGYVVTEKSGALSIRSARFEVSEDSHLAFESLDIDIDLPLLVAGIIKVRSIGLINPVVTLGPKIFESSKKERDKSPDKTAIPFIPKSPVTIEVENLFVKNLKLELNQSLTERIKIDGANFFLSSKIDSESAQAKAIISWSEKDAAIEVKRGEIFSVMKPAGELEAALDGAGSLQVGAKTLIIVQRLEGIPDAARFQGMSAGVELTASGNMAQRFIGSANGELSLFEKKLLSFNANLEEAENSFDYRMDVNGIDVDLEKLAKFAHVPDFKIEGKTNIPSMEVFGKIEKSGGVTANVSGDVKIFLTHLSGPEFSLSRGGEMSLALDTIAYDGATLGGEATIIVKSKIVERESLRVKEISMNTRVAIDGAAEKPKLDVEADWAVSSMVSSGYDFGAFSGRIGAVGDFIDGDLSDIETTMKAAEGAELKIKGAVKKFGAAGLGVTAEVKTPIDIWSDYGPVAQLPIIADGGVISVNTRVDGSMGDEFSEPALRFDIAINGENISGKLQNAEGALDDSGLSIKAKGKIGHSWKPSDLDGKGVLKISGINLPKTADIGETKITFAIDSADPYGGATKITAQIESDKITPFDKKLRPLPVLARMTLEADAESKTAELSEAMADLGDFGSFSAPLAKIDEEGRFSGSVKAKKLDLGFLFAMVPANVREKSGVASAGGRLSMNIEGETSSGFSADWYPFPFSLSGKIELEKGALKAPEQGIETEGADLSISFSADGPSASISGEGSVDRLAAREVFGKVEVDPTIDFDVKIGPDGVILIDHLIVDTPALGFIESLEGSVAGLPIAEIDKWSKKPAALLTVIDVDLKNYLRLFLDERQKFLETTDIDGEAAIETEITSTKGDQLKIAVVANLSGVTVLQNGEALVENASGKIPFEKRLSYTEEGLEEEEVNAIKTATTVRDTSFFDDIRAAGGGARDEATVDIIAAGPVKLSKSAFDIQMSGRRFGVDYFRTSLLDGGLTGSFAIKGEGEEYSLRSSMIFAGLDIEKVLNKDLGLGKKETGLDGTTTLELRLKEGGDLKTLDISNIDLAVYLTRIDAKALSKLLLFLDPKESSPAIMNARIALRFAKPKRVELLARHGILSLTIDLVYSPLLGGQSVRMPVIKRAPINSLTRFGKIREAVNSAAVLNQVMLAVGATRIIIDEEGGVTLR